MADDMLSSGPGQSPFATPASSPNPHAVTTQAVAPSVTAALPEPIRVPGAGLDPFAAGMIQLAVGLVVALIAAGVVWSMGLGRGALLLAPALGLVAYGATRLFLPHPSPAHAKEAGARSTQHVPVDSTREVIETVVFVIVLVLMLKSFVAEAFVIPTGSMAETLYGYQKVITCPECGLQFPVNCSTEVEAQDGQMPQRIANCVCPNCRKHIFLKRSGADPNGPQMSPPHGADVIDDPGPTSGDRVLVAKFLFDLFNKDPDRLDVVVFKFPGNGNPDDPNSPRFPLSGPFKNHVPMNYIKRLIGLPGETIAIQGGKIYILPANKSPRYDDLAQAKTPAERHDLEQQLWQYRYMHNDDKVARDLFNQHQFQILRKGPDNILSMKRLVYDNDHQARDLKGKVPPRWAGDGWTNDEATGYLHKKNGADKLAWLHYRHLLRDRGIDNKVEPELITDFMGYNSGGSFIAGSQGENWTRDLILECEMTIDQPQGELVLELARGVDRFQARFNLADGLCKLVRLTGKPTDKPEVKELGSVKTTVQKGTYQLRFSDVDERLLLWVNDKLVTPDGVIYEAPKDLAPKEWNDLEPAGVGIKGTSAHVQHLKLWRDIYYTTGRGEVSGFNPAKPDTWGGFQDMPVRTMYIQPDHFLCLGDNSPASADSRQWGQVPRRLLLGKALSVYYPFFFPFWPLNSQVNRIGLIH